MTPFWRDKVRSMPHFTLTVATSSDGYISRTTDEPPQAWASAEEQDLFFRDVEAADWAIMGRNTHEAADKPHRRRIIFSSQISGWRRPTQLWVNPKEMTPADLAQAVSAVHPFEKALILGGTRVHDWFLAHRSIDKVHLTIEPVRFGAGLPVFSDQDTCDPVGVFQNAGFEVLSETVLNAAGTGYFELGNSV
jgi:dihydrofolate reductase